jgi:uracil-DNA glycosylase family 4
MEHKEAQRIIEYLETQHRMGQPCHKQIRKDLYRLKFELKRDVEAEYWHRMFKCPNWAEIKEEFRPELQDKMEELRSRIEACERCKEITRLRKHFKFRKLLGCGSLKPILMFVTVAPSWRNPTIKSGYKGEQASFIYWSFYFWHLLADAGILDKRGIEAIEAEKEIYLRASKLNRLLEGKRIYISDTLKCPVFKVNPKTGKFNNRNPTWDEVLNCMKWLREEISLLKPKVVCTLGEIPFKAVYEDSKAVPEWCKPCRYNEHITVFPCHFPKRYKGRWQTYIEEFRKLKELLESDC